jgi:protein SCO1/2
MERIALIGLLAVPLVGCGRLAGPGEAAQHYETRGVVRGFSPDRQTIDIQHENIPRFMPSMTMPFIARNPKEIADLKAGDAISFRVTVTKRDFWIDHVKKIQRGDVDVAEPKQTPSIPAEAGARLREGDEMPFFSLTNQKGERVSLQTFRGGPFLLTFVFTRCPLPNFCPRMSNNFEELQAAIKGGAGALAKTHLLSITLDPGFDTPKVLKGYGAFHHADPQVWTFATGDKKEIEALTRAFSVYRQTEGGTISHGLATALVNSDGTIDKIWRGNAWTPAEVVEAIRAERKE